MSCCIAISVNVYSQEIIKCYIVKSMKMIQDGNKAKVILPRKEDKWANYIDGGEYSCYLFVLCNFPNTQFFFVGVIIIFPSLYLLPSIKYNAHTFFFACVWKYFDKYLLTFAFPIKITTIKNVQTKYIYDYRYKKKSNLL